MPPEDLDRTVQWQRCDRVTSSGRGCGLEQRVVNGLLSGFNHGEEEWRHSIVCKCFLIARHISLALTERLEPYVSGRREGDGIIAAAIAGRSAGAGKAHHRPRCETVEVARVYGRVGRDHDDD